MSELIQKLPSNTQGKDYVIGDLHGCFELLERLLDKVAFDESIDRLFSVGDLIDRGPNSMKCLNLLAEPWFYAVQGNHENMMLNFFWRYLTEGRIEDLYAHDNHAIDFLLYGGDWVQRYHQPETIDMTEEFNLGLSRCISLPLILVVGEQKNRFHIVHAELVRSDYRKSGQFVWLDRDIDNWLETGDIAPGIQERLYWGRTLMSQRRVRRFQKGLSPTFCGHTYDNRPRQVLSHVCLDTGAFISVDYPKDVADYGLTLFDVQASCWYSASYQRNNIVSGKLPLRSWLTF